MVRSERQTAVLEPLGLWDAIIRESVEDPDPFDFLLPLLRGIFFTNIKETMNAIKRETRKETANERMRTITIHKLRDGLKDNTRFKLAI